MVKWLMNLIQERADNVDGKNTFHSLVKTFVQLQENTTKTKFACVKDVRGHTRSLYLD